MRATACAHRPRAHPGTRAAALGAIELKGVQGGGARSRTGTLASPSESVVRTSPDRAAPCRGGCSLVNGTPRTPKPRGHEGGNA